MNQQVRTTRIVLTALIAPAIVTIVALAISFWLARDGGSVVVHWNAAGVPDGHGSPETYPILLAVLVLPLVAIFGAIAVSSTHRGPITPTIKLLAVIGLWLSVGIGVAFVGILATESGTSASTTLAPLPIGFVVATVIAIGAWFALPPVEHGTVERPITITPTALGATERASWMHSTASTAVMLWGLIALTVVLGALVVISVVVTGGTMWWVSFIPFVVLLAALSNLAWTVRVDARGVRVRSLLGIPTFRVPIDTIRAANVIEVHPLADFGGWGLRFGVSGRMGVVMRAGQALEIVRTNGRALVVTVDDASSGAALINALVQRDGAVLP